MKFLILLFVFSAPLLAEQSQVEPKKSTVDILFTTGGEVGRVEVNSKIFETGPLRIEYFPTAMLSIGDSISYNIVSTLPWAAFEYAITKKFGKMPHLKELTVSQRVLAYLAVMAALPVYLTNISASLGDRNDFLRLYGKLRTDFYSQGLDDIEGYGIFAVETGYRNFHGGPFLEKNFNNSKDGFGKFGLEFRVKI